MNKLVTIQDLMMGFEERRTRELLAKIEAKKEQWAHAKQTQLQEPLIIHNSKGVEELRELGILNADDNCDTTHRLYLTGEQFDNESFEVQKAYKFCPRCIRFYNSDELKYCRCKGAEIL